MEKVNVKKYSYWNWNSEIGKVDNDYIKSGVFSNTKINIVGHLLD